MVPNGFLQVATYLSGSYNLHRREGWARPRIVHPQDVEHDRG